MLKVLNELDETSKRRVDILQHFLVSESVLVVNQISCKMVVVTWNESCPTLFPRPTPSQKHNIYNPELKCLIFVISRVIWHVLATRQRNRLFILIQVMEYQYFRLILLDSYESFKLIGDMDQVFEEH